MRPLRALARSPLVHVVLKRLAMGVLLLFVVTALSFVLVSFTPGDAARQILSVQGTQEQYLALKHELGLDLPLYEQYWNWLSGAVQGDLGESVYGNGAVTDVIDRRLPVTLWLIAGSMVVTLVVGTALGVVSAVRGGVLDRAVGALTLTGFALPSFWVGAVLISIFAVRLEWLPATGYVAFATSPVDWLRSLVLPVAALALGGIATVAKQTREAMLDVLGSEYIRMARASGLSRRSIVYRHALKNAGMRVVTILGILAVGLLSGTVIVEAVFALPGLGGLAVEATARSDLPVIQGVVVYFTVLVVLVNLVVDLAYTWLNPKVRAR